MGDIEMMFPSGQRVRSGDRIAPDWTGSRELPPDIRGTDDVAWNVAIVLDLDAPCAPFLHWLVVRQPADGRFHQLVPWAPMRPPFDSPPHRYVLLLFAAPVVPRGAPSWLLGRPRFDLGRLTAQWRLTRLADLQYQSGYGAASRPPKGDIPHNRRPTFVAKAF